MPRTECGPAVTVVNIARVYGAHGGSPALTATVSRDSPWFRCSWRAGAHELDARIVSEHVLVLASGRAGVPVRAVGIAAGAAPDLGARDLQPEVRPVVAHRPGGPAQVVPGGDRAGREVP